MASTAWLKVKSAEEAKALFKHDERDKRSDTKVHRNFHIDKSKTHLNRSVIGRTYKERCDMYDKAIRNAEAVAAGNTETYVIKSGKNAGKTVQRKKNRLRKDSVTVLNLYTPTPKDLQEERQLEWFIKLHDIIVGFFGEENVIDSDIHFDEVHEYYDPVLKEWTLSRVHMQTSVLPITADGRLCCNDIFTRENCKKLNDLIEDMTQREFGIGFNTGETPRRETVENLKSKSYAAELELFNELEAKISERQKYLESLNADISNMEKYWEAMKATASADEKYSNELDEEISEKEGRLKSLNTDISEKEKFKKQLDYKISELSSDIADSTLVAKAGVEKLHELDKEIQARQQQITDAKEELEKINGNITKRETELTTLDEIKSEKIGKLNNAIQNRIKRINELNSYIVTLKNTHNYMQNQKKVDNMVLKANAMTQSANSLSSQGYEIPNL